MPTTFAQRTFGFALLLAGVVAVSAIRLPRLTESYEASHRGTNEGAYLALHVKHHLEFGFEFTKGLNVQFVVPTTPPKPIFYASHPPTLAWTCVAASKAFGFSEAVLRSVGLAFFFIGLVGLYVLVRDCVGPAYAGLAALLWATTPAIGSYGVAAATDCAASSLGLWAAVFAASYARRGGRSRLLLVALMSAGAAAFDWPGYFYVPASTLLAFLLGGSGAAKRVCVAAAAGACVAAAAYAVPLLAAYGGWDATFAALLAVAKKATGRADGGGFDVVFGHVLALTGGSRAVSIGFLAVAAVGLASGLFVRAVRGVAAVAISLIVPGALCCVVFPRHAAIHDFWWTPALPGLCAAVVAAFAAVRGTSVGVSGARRLLLALGWLASFAVAAAGVVEAERLSRAARFPEPREAAAALDLAFGPSDVVLTDEWWFTAAPYARARILAEIRTKDAFDAYMGMLRGAGLDDRDVTFVTKRTFIKDEPELIEALARFGERTEAYGFELYRGRG